MLGPDDGAGREGHRAADDRSKVLWVLDLVECQKERARRDLELRERQEFELGHHRHRSLMANTARAVIELGAGCAHHRGALIAREPHQRFELRLIAFFDDDSFDLCAVGPHGLAHGLQTHNEAHETYAISAAIARAAAAGSAASRIGRPTTMKSAPSAM